MAFSDSDYIGKSLKPDIDRFADGSVDDFFSAYVNFFLKIEVYVVEKRLLKTGHLKSRNLNLHFILSFSVPKKTSYFLIRKKTVGIENFLSFFERYNFTSRLFARLVQNCRKLCKTAEKVSKRAVKSELIFCCFLDFSNFL